MRTLFLTTPMMVGEDVADLQRALAHPARPDLAGVDFLQSPAGIDGVFGEDTHRAVYRAKYWLGYTNPDHKAAEKLIEFLNGVRPPTNRMTLLRTQRLAGSRKESPGFRKLREAVKYLGVKERPPRSNKVMFANWYDVAGPWCAMFVSFCGANAGIKAYCKSPPGRWAYVPYMVEDARAGRYHYAITHKPVSGDDAAYDFAPKDGVADHVGIFASEEDLRLLAAEDLDKSVRKFGPLRSDEFWAVEGNTTVGDDSDGGEVMLRKRRKADVLAFMHPGR
jgi:hypothetical protein